MRNLIIAVIVIVVLVGGYFLLKNSYKQPSTSSTATKQTTETTTQPSEEAKSEVTITYTSSGFSPDNVTVTSGGKVTFVNNSNDTVQVNSTPHPSHTDNSELNVGSVGPGESKSTTVSKSSCYHNHLEASEGGCITVK